MNTALLAFEIRGVVEGIVGCQGSKDWIRFGSVFYLAKPLVNEREALHDIR